MEHRRPIVLSIAGFDPCAGAGVLADIKTFEQHGVYGLAVNSAQTIQTEDSFISMRWENPDEILKAIGVLMGKYMISAIKIGIVENIEVLNKVLDYIYQIDTSVKIVWDPVLQSSTGFNFWNRFSKEESLMMLLSRIWLITPNYHEILQLNSMVDAETAAKMLSGYCKVLLKGGHNAEAPGRDYLFMEEERIILDPGKRAVSSKHGSGCVLSSAITARLALGEGTLMACSGAKRYVENFLSSSPLLLGYHNV